MQRAQAPEAKFRRILHYALSERRSLAVLLALSCVLAASTALQPWPLKLLIDYALGDALLPAWLGNLVDGTGLSRAPVLILAAAAATIALFSLTAALDAAITLGWSHAGQRMVYALATDLFAHLQKLSLRFHARRSVGDALSRVTGDAWCVHTVTEGILVSPFRQLLVVCSVGVFAWQLDPGLTQLVLVCVPLMSIAAWFFGQRLKHAERAKREAGASLNAFTHQVLGAIPLVQAFGAATRNAEVFSGLAQRVVRANETSAVLTHVFGLATGAATTIGAALVIYAGGERVLARELPLGTLLVFLVYVRTLDSALRALLRTYGTLRGAEASVDRVLEIADARDRIEERPGARALPERTRRGSGAIVFDRVTFGYDSGTAVLKGVSLAVNPGETVALVGRTGAGKSTLAALVPRFFDPWEGRVLVDGVDLKDLKTASLRAEIALVLQEPFILPISVLDNIAYGRPDASRDDIVAAAVAANAHEFIRALPRGYQTIIGEHGATLSGGQQQRLAIARALLKDPRILVLDEPTSALDGRTEELVMSALERLTADRTTLIIAHRLATVRRADRIAVMDDGRIVETGSHVELLAAGGLYARLYALAAFDAVPDASQ